VKIFKLGELKLAWKITEVEKSGCEGIADFLYRIYWILPGIAVRRNVFGAVRYRYVKQMLIRPCV
jgi:hypothetical protein